MWQVYEVRLRRDEAGDIRKSLEGALDHLAEGVIVIGRDGVVAFANSAADEMALRGDGISLRSGKFQLELADARIRLDAALVATLCEHQSLASNVCDFPVARPNGPPYIVSVRALGDSERKRRAGRGAVAIVFVRDPLNRTAAAIGVLRAIFGLTEAEAALAQALQTGIAPAEYSRTHGISLNTVYTHLRRLREKTGCSRMLELTARLNDVQARLRRI